jgi:hypothetical protein
MSPDHAPRASAESPAFPRIEPSARPPDGVAEAEGRLRVSVMNRESEPLPEAVLLQSGQKMRGVTPGEITADVERAPAEAVGLLERPEMAGRLVQYPVDGQRFVDEAYLRMGGGMG